MKIIFGTMVLGDWWWCVRRLRDYYARVA